MKFKKEKRNLLCKDCGGEMKIKVGKYGFFYGCSDWNINHCHSGFSCFQDTGEPFIPNKEQNRKKFYAENLSSLELNNFRMFKI